MNTLDLLALRRLCERASGPVWIVDYDKREDGCDHIRCATTGRTIAFMATPAEITEDDAEFIVAARTALPQLLDAVEALADSLQRLVDFLNSKESGDIGSILNNARAALARIGR